MKFSNKEIKLKLEEVKDDLYNGFSLSDSRAFDLLEICTYFFNKYKKLNKE